MGQNFSHYLKGFKPEYFKNPKKYNEAELWTKFEEYIKDNDTQSWDRDDFIKSGPDAGKIVSVQIPNPPSIMGFCAFAGITEQTYNNYRKSGNSNFEVAHMIQAIIRTIQVGGGMTNTWNAGIVGRLAELIDKKELELKSDMSDDERMEKIKSILDGIKKKDDADDLL